MNRGEAFYRAIKDAGKEGLTKSQLTIILWRMDVPSAARDARKDWVNPKTEQIVTKMEKDKFLGLFDRLQARYMYKRIRNRN